MLVHISLRSSTPEAETTSESMRTLGSIMKVLFSWHLLAPQNQAITSGYLTNLMDRFYLLPLSCRTPTDPGCAT
jgi:hypothetical protein